MKTRWKHLITGVTLFVLCISVCPTTANAAVVWQDDFENPDLPGWTIFRYDNLSTQVMTEGNWSAPSGMLIALDDEINVARHNSTLTVGTWSFDMFVPDDDDEFWAAYVYFMSSGSKPIPAFASDFICIGTENWSPHFIVLQNIGYQWTILKEIAVDSLPGWHHIDVSRTSDGHFYIYFNGTYKEDFVRNQVTSSTYLEVWSNNAVGAAIDNLIVSDDLPPTPTPTPTTPTTPPPESTLWILIAVGGGVAVGVIVLAIVFLKRR